MDNKPAWRTLLDPLEWEKKYRARCGTTLDHIRAVGQTAVCDWTSNDVHLVSRTSRLRPIGYSGRLFIHDAFSDIICGLHTGLEAASQWVALQAVLSGATSQVAYFARHGVEIEEDDCPAIFFSKYLVDNGEFRTAKAIEILTSLQSGLEFTRVGRADMKGRSEAGHRTIHKRAGHKMTGTTRGRQRQRGQSNPAELACWMSHEFTRILLKTIRYVNREQRVPEFMDKHPFRTAMKQDGVTPTRKAIYQWGVANGLVASPPFDEDHLRTRLLPQFRASVHSDGVYLIRPDRGRKIDRVRGHRFIGPRALEYGWLERARRDGPFFIDVHLDHNRLDCIWHADENGIAELRNQSNDVPMVMTGVLAETLAIQDEDVVDEDIARDQTDQARAEHTAAVAAADELHKRQKLKEIADAEEKVTKKGLSSNVRENRQSEMAENPDQQEIVNEIESGSELLPDTNADTGSDAVDDLLNRHRTN
ncbi:MAG: hypothetical protein HKN69_09305 [Desulfofustis sp.]|nr:hypothetical protein [Desulfofustis sp.]